MAKQHENGMIIVLSGPSGVGKGTIFQGVCARLPELKRSVSVTTRAPRPGETDGVHYYFKSLDEYQSMIAAGAFLETAEVYCNYYGTPKAPVFKMLSEGYDVIFELDTYGAKQMKRAYPEAVLIFVMPPSLEELERRLRNRGTETEDAISRRKAAAARELKEYDNYDYFVLNDIADEAIDNVLAIIKAERFSVKRNAELILKTILKDV